MLNPAAIFVLASKNILNDRVRLAMTVTGVGLAVSLILLLRGITRGTLDQSTSFIDNSPDNLFIVQKNNENLYQGYSILPAGMETTLANLDHVVKVEKYLRGGTTFKTADNREANFFIFGIDPARFEGPFWHLRQGRYWENAGEVGMDDVLARQYNLKLGDQIWVRNLPFTIVGLTEGGYNPLGRYVFTTIEGAQQVVRLENVVNYFSVLTDSRVDPDTVITAIKTAIPDIEVYSRQEFHRNHRRLVQESLMPPIAIMSLISFAVGSAIIGLTLYTTTVEKKRDFGILKAIGATSPYLYQIVGWQAVIDALIGFVFGCLLAFMIRWIMRWATPEISVVIDPSLIVLTYGVANLMSLLAALIPARIINRVDPAIVFKQ